MTSRERVLASLDHREPDRPPVDLSGHRSSGINAIAYRKLRAALGLPARVPRVYDPVQQLAIVEEDALALLGVDTIELGRAFALGDEHWVDWVLPDGSPCQMPAWAKPEREVASWVIRSRTGRVIARMPDGAHYFEQTHWPFARGEDLGPLGPAFDESMWTAIGSPPGPLVAGAEGQALLAEGAARLRAEQDRAIIGLFGGNLLEVGTFLYGIDEFLWLLAAEPQRAHAFLDRVVELHLGNLERFLGAVGGSIDVILFGDDLGGTNGPMISPSMYREFFAPRHAVLWGRAKALANAKAMLHCCGGVRELLPDLIGAGLDAINPVQISCRGMAPEGLKRDFGRDLVFWGGGCDTTRVLPRGTPAEVRAHVRDMARIWSPGGGWVFQQVHNILPEVPIENVLAMYEGLRGE
jgi:uroporphyrinogen decarboxylase